MLRADYKSRLVSYTKNSLLPEGLPSWLTVIELMLWMLYCDEAIINCDNYGGAITFDLAVSGERKEKKEIKETITKKRRR